MAADEAEIFLMHKITFAAILGALFISGSASLSCGAQKLPRDMLKGAIEAPTKSLLSAPSPVAAGNPQINPPVQPGLVRWHSDFASACQASKISGKPVLLFQMLGMLNREYT